MSNHTSRVYVKSSASLYALNFVGIPGFMFLFYFVMYSVTLSWSFCKVLRKRSKTEENLFFLFLFFLAFCPVEVLLFKHSFFLLFFVFDFWVGALTTGQLRIWNYLCNFF